MDGAFLAKYAHERLQLEEPLIMAGDYNVIPAAADVHNPAAWATDALFLPQTRAPFRTPDQSRPDRCTPRGQRQTPASTPSGTIRPAPGRRTGASASTICCCRRRPPTGSTTAGIDKRVRSWDKPSDHVPVYVDLEIEPVAHDRPDLRRPSTQRLSRISAKRPLVVAGLLDRGVAQLGDPGHLGARAVAGDGQPHQARGALTKAVLAAEQDAAEHACDL